MRLIAIDIGNSTINAGFFINDSLVSFKISTWPLKTAGEYLGVISDFLVKKNIEKNMDGVIISSVVPSHTGIIIDAVKGVSKSTPLIAGAGLDLGLSFDVLKPEEIGSDRLANAVCACKVLGVPVIVVDFGTAATITAVDISGKYIGGAILPGAEMMKKSLSKNTAQLPEVALTQPVSVLGKNPRECILSGIIYGMAGAVERIIDDIQAGEGYNFKVAVTGGAAPLILPLLKKKDLFEPDLTLKGLRLIYERSTLCMN